MGADELVEREAIVTAVSMGAACTSIAQHFMGLLTASQAADGASAMACLCALYAVVTSSVAPVCCSGRRTCSIPAVRQPGHACLLKEPWLVFAAEEDESGARLLVINPPPAPDTP